MYDVRFQKGKQLAILLIKGFPNPHKYIHHTFCDQGKVKTQSCMSEIQVVK